MRDDPQSTVSVDNFENIQLINLQFGLAFGIKDSFPAYKQSFGCISNVDGLEWLKVINLVSVTSSENVFFYPIKNLLLTRGQ